MIIDSIEIRACRHTAKAEASHMRAGGDANFDFLVVTMHTDEGVTGNSLGFAGRNAEAAGQTAAAILKPFFLSRDPLARERHWQDFRTYDRWWHHAPIYAYGCFDICLWDIAAKTAGVPLYRLLGEYRDKTPTYASSFVLETPGDYALQAIEVKQRGWHAYKIHPPGRMELDLEIYRACREAVGPEFCLMADPVAAYNHQQALRVGRELERLDYYWFEEPLLDTDFYGLRKLTAALEIPVCGTEVLAGHIHSTAECIASNVVDIVRTDVSWKGGVTPVMKTAHLAESFGLQCELHTAIFHALEVVNLHCCCAISNCEFFELLYPTTSMEVGLRSGIQIDEEGYAHPPSAPGTGVDFDWGFIDNCTVLKL